VESGRRRKEQEGSGEGSQKGLGEEGRESNIHKRSIKLKILFRDLRISPGKPQRKFEFFLESLA
jgi:hypothetical protein